MRCRRLLAPLTLAVALLAVPAGAHATDYYVAPGGAGSADTLGEALTLAAANNNGDPQHVIHVAAGAYDGDAAGVDDAPFSYTGTKPLRIVGAGSGQTGTVLTAGTSSGAVLSLTGSTGYEVSGLRVRTAVAGTNNQTGLEIRGGGAGSRVSDLVVETVTSAAYGSAVVIDGSGVALQNATLDLNSNTAGVSFGGGGGCPCGGHALGDVTIDGGSYGIFSAMGSGSETFTADRMRIIGPATAGIWVQEDNAATVNDSLVVLSSGSGGTGLYANGSNSQASSPGIEARNVTIVGRGTSQTGAWAHAGDTGDDVGIELRDSVIRDVSTPLHAGGAASGATSTVETHDSSVPDTGNQDAPGSGWVVSNSDGAVAKTATLAQLGFVDAANDDFRPRWDSPLVDAGSATALYYSGESDLLGGLRLVNARRDVGALEYQRAAPAVALAASATTAEAGGLVGFSGNAIDADPGETAALAYAWSFDDGTAPLIGSTGFQHAFATPGAHVVTLTVTDPAGVATVKQVTVDVSQKLATAPAGAGGTPAPVPTGPAPTANKATTATPATPTITGKPKLTVSRTRKPSRLTTLTLTLSAAGKVKLALQQKAGHRWRALKGSLTLTAKKGRSSFRLETRKPFKGLKKGGYRVSIVVLDSKGAKPRKAIYATFAIR